MILRQSGATPDKVQTTRSTTPFSCTQNLRPIFDVVKGDLFVDAL